MCLQTMHLYSWCSRRVTNTYDDGDDDFEDNLNVVAYSLIVVL